MSITVVRTTMVVLVLLTAGIGAVHGQSSQSSKPTPQAAKQPPQPAQEAQTLNLHAYAELLRSDVRTQKVSIITEVMGFTEAESAKFWPIYREYDAEMAKLGDARAA